MLIDWHRLAQERTGYEMQTTFGNDFDIAEAFGPEAVKETYTRAFKEWRSDYKYLTELVLILNWKIWQHYETENMDLAHLYNDLWIEADTYARDNLTGKELEYFYRTTD